MFYFNQIFHNLSHQFFKNLILIKFLKIEDNDLYVYKKKSFKKLVIWIFFTFHGDMKPRASDNPKK
jgi:hypothetical protein